MNKDKKTLDDSDQSLIKESVDPFQKLTKSIDQDIIQLEKDLFLEENNFLNTKKNIEKEIEIIKKRTQKDIENSYKFSLEKFINELLPIIDNLERALVLADKSNNDFIEIITKIESTLKLYLDVLNKFNVTKINAINTPFNPEIHQAISIQFSESVKDNYVISILQNGYLLHNRLLRPAMVIVSKTKQ